MVNCFKPGVLIAWIFCVIAPAQGAAIKFLSQTATFDPATDLVTFRIDFDRPPDFFTTDSVGRQEDSFQYYILGDPSLGYPAEYDSIVRGAEIPIANDINIRNAIPGVSDSAAGGWGAIRDVVPYELNGSLLTFSAPLASLSNHSVDGHFSYDLEVFAFGAEVQSVQAQTTVIPEPSALVTLSLGLVALIVYRLRRVADRGWRWPRSQGFVAARRIVRSNPSFIAGIDLARVAAGTPVHVRAKGTPHAPIGWDSIDPFRTSPHPPGTKLGKPRIAA
jgi:hypothetical protein